MNIFINQVNRSIIGLNTTNNLAAYVINVASNFDFTQTLGVNQYARQFVTNTMVASRQFPPAALNQMLYLTPTGVLTTIAQGNIPAFTVVTNSQQFTFSQAPTQFTVNDVIIAKANYILASEMYKYIYIDELIDFSSLNTSLNTDVNLSIKNLELLPGGSCTTTSITLTEPTNIFGYYLEGTTATVTVTLNYGANETMVLTSLPNIISNVVNNVTLTFNNVGTTPQVIQCYGLLF